MASTTSTAGRGKLFAMLSSSHATTTEPGSFEKSTSSEERKLLPSSAPSSGETSRPEISKYKSV